MIFQNHYLLLLYACNRKSKKQYRGSTTCQKSFLISAPNMSLFWQKILDLFMANTQKISNVHTCKTCQVKGFSAPILFDCFERFCCMILQECGVQKNLLLSAALASRSSHSEFMSS